MKHKKEGYVILLALIFLTIFAALIAGTINYASQYSKLENHVLASEQATQLAEAGIDKALSQLNQNASYTGEANTALGAGTFTIAVTSVNSSEKTITATGYVPNSTSPTAQKTVKVNANIGNSVISFRYGIQVGNGGFIMNGGSTVNGSIYSNGDIVATNGVHITGAAVAANQPATTTDQVNNTPIPIASCTSSTCITFANGNSTEDFAQSFQTSSDVPLNNIQFYIKKVGSPSDETVNIVTDNAGLPSTNVLMSGTLSASSVTTNFGWVTVTMPTTPILNPGTTYWMVINGASNSSKYYIIGANSGGYALGQAKIGRSGGTWMNTTPSGLDGYFQIYLAGGTSTIGGNTYSTGVYIGTTGTDDAWAHKVQGATVSGTMYCQVGSFDNRTCNTSRSDPTPQPMPITDAQIQEWKNEASAGTTISGDYHVGYAGATIGPAVITGNLLIDGGGTLTIAGTLWVQGTFTITSGATARLAASYGTNSGVLLTDGPVSVAGGSNFAGSGQTGSYPFVITTSACPVTAGCSGADAIDLSGGAGTVALVAEDGTVHVSGGSALKQVTARQVTMDGGATLYYDSGLINENFSSGPGGSWQIVPGTYVLQ